MWLSLIGIIPLTFRSLINPYIMNSRDIINYSLKVENEQDLIIIIYTYCWIVWTEYLPVEFHTPTYVFRRLIKMYNKKNIAVYNAICILIWFLFVSTDMEVFTK